MAISAQSLVQSECVADSTAIEPGKPFTVALHLRIADNWHVYWLNPGDAGAATTLKITVPDGFTVSAVQYPVPEKLAIPGGLTIFAYEKEALFTATITPPRNLAGLTSVPISAAAAWCVCDPQQCLLGKKTLQLNLPLAGAGPVADAGAKPANVALFAAWRSRLPADSDQTFASIDITPGDQSDTEKLAFTWKTAPPAANFSFLPAPYNDLNIQDLGAQSNGRTTVVTLKIDPVQGISPTSSTINGVLAYYGTGGPPSGVAVTLNRLKLRLPLPATAAGQ
jgi:thiol:disulfide interchange protein DsbD